MSKFFVTGHVVGGWNPSGLKLLGPPDVNDDLGPVGQRPLHVLEAGHVLARQHLDVG